MVPRKQAHQTVLTGTLKTTVYCWMLQVSINTLALSCIHIPTPLLKLSTLSQQLWDLPHRLLWQAMLWEFLIKTNTTVTLAFRNKHQSHQKFQEAGDNLSTHIQSAIYNPAKGMIGQAASIELRPSRKWEVLSHDTPVHINMPHICPADQLIKTGSLSTVYCWFDS